MGKIILVLPGNFLHANVLPDRWEEMYQSRAGLDEIGSSGVHVTVAYQAMDFQLIPWLEETVRKYRSIELINSTYSHALLPLIHSNELKRWETEPRINWHAPVTFFPEFYAPEDWIIPTKYFFVLEGQSYLYSAFTNTDCFARDVEVQATEENNLSIHYGDKIGIMLKEGLFRPFLNAFFRFQRDPVTKVDGRSSLDKVLDEVEKIGNSPKENLVICPLDLEAPFIGSALGVKVWEMFFQGVNQRGLTKVFTSLSDKLDLIAFRGSNSKRPHRILTKWTVFEVQLKHLLQMNQVNPETKQEKILFSLAMGSDILAAWERKISETKSDKKVILSGRDLKGKEIALPVSFNQQVIDLQLMAKWALVDRNRLSYLIQKRINELGDVSLLMERALVFAEKFDL